MHAKSSASSHTERSADGLIFTELPNGQGAWLKPDTATPVERYRLNPERVIIVDQPGRYALTEKGKRALGIALLCDRGPTVAQVAVERMTPDELERAIRVSELEGQARVTAELERGQGTISARIRHALYKRPAPASAADLAMELDEDAHAIYATLRRMSDVERMKRGRSVRFSLKADPCR